MTQIVEAIYENGMFRPIPPADLPLLEGQQVRLEIERRSRARFEHDDGSRIRC